MIISNILTKIDGKLLTEKVTGENTFYELYAGDLLSNILGHASSRQLLVTIMANVNTVAVAVMLDLPGIIIAENHPVNQSMIKRANDEGIAIITTALSVVEVIRHIYSE